MKSFLLKYSDRYYKKGHSSVYIGEELENLKKYILTEKSIYLVDENVLKLYGKKIHGDFVIPIPQGEKSKTCEMLTMVYSKLLEFDADRSNTLIGIGGGVTTDLTGYVASTFLRGIDFGFVATSLLAQVDASIGGKNGINFLGYKNLIGTINHPRFVICDINFLRTLPFEEMSNGFAEIIKHALICDSKYFNLLDNYIKNNTTEKWNLATDMLEHIVYKSVKIKAGIIKNDEFENGKRRLLNFGHTLGHALEKILSNEGMSHGKAVSLGMVFALKFSMQYGNLGKNDFNKIVSLLSRVGLPVEIEKNSKQYVISGLKEKILEGMYKDKKRYGQTIKFVLLDKIGKAKIDDVTYMSIESVLDEFLK